MFSVTLDIVRKTIRARLSGFLSPEEVHGFADELQEAARVLGGRGDHVLLVDTSGCLLQSQDVVKAFRDIILHAPIKSRKIAVIHGDSLSRMQTRRILMRDDAGLFDTVAAAEHWLYARSETEISGAMRAAG